MCAIVNVGAHVSPSVASEALVHQCFGEQARLAWPGVTRGADVYSHVWCNALLRSRTCWLAWLGPRYSSHSRSRPSILDRFDYALGC